MTTHYSSQYLVKPYLMLLGYQSKKDGTKQVAVRVRVKHRQSKKESHINIACRDEFGDAIKLIPSEFKSNKYDISIKQWIADIQERAVFACHHFLSHGIAITQKEIQAFVYNKMADEQQAKEVYSKEFVTDPTIVKQLEELDIDQPIAKDVVNKVSAMPPEDLRSEELSDEDHLHEILTSEQVEYNKRKQEAALREIRERREAEIQAMSLDERYVGGHFDHDNIFEVFGFCWSYNKDKNAPYVPTVYKSLVLKLADFRVNAQPSEHIQDFNEDWVKDFILFLRDEGYACVHPKKYTPFNIREQDFRLLESKREIYTYKSFDKQIKHLKGYIDILQGNGIIDKHTINTKYIKTKNYLSNTHTNYTRSSHSLNMSEIHKIMDARFSGKLETTRQMFLIQIFAGGLRNEEFYNEHFRLKNSDGFWYFQFYQDKGDKVVENPLIEDYTDAILEQMDYTLPNLLPVEEYRQNLTKMAQEIGLDREIMYKIPMADDSVRIETPKVMKILNPYWARKTFIKFGVAQGWTYEKIMQYTGHTETKTLKHYFDQLSAEEKQRL